jgi:hypothetical protein
MPQKSSGNDMNCGKEALKFLLRTQNAENPHKHKSIVCVICDQFIIGTETIHYLSKDSISEHSHRNLSKVMKPTMRSLPMRLLDSGKCGDCLQRS